MREQRWFWIILFNATGMIHTGCHDDKPVIQADPDFANCSADKSIIENGCLKDAGTRADFDECIARVRKSCVDGGAR